MPDCRSFLPAVELPWRLNGKEMTRLHSSFNDDSPQHEPSSNLPMLKIEHAFAQNICSNHTVNLEKHRKLLAIGTEVLAPMQDDWIQSGALLDLSKQDN